MPGRKPQQRAVSPLLKLWTRQLPLCQLILWCTTVGLKLTATVWQGNELSPVQSGFDNQQFLFPALNKLSSGHGFTCDEDVKCATSTWLMHTRYAFYVSGMDIPFCDKYNCQGDYVEKQHTTDTFTVYSHVSSIKFCFLFWALQVTFWSTIIFPLTYFGQFQEDSVYPM
jgi:hypothetical protein